MLDDDVGIALHRGLITVGVIVAAVCINRHCADLLDHLVRVLRLQRVVLVQKFIEPDEHSTLDASLQEVKRMLAALVTRVKLDAKTA